MPLPMFLGGIAKGIAGGAAKGAAKKFVTGKKDKKQGEDIFNVIQLDIYKRRFYFVSVSQEISDLAHLIELFPLLYLTNTELPRK